MFGNEPEVEAYETHSIFSKNVPGLGLRVAFSAPLCTPLVMNVSIS